MNQPELHRVEVIQKLSDKRLTESEAAEQCHLYATHQLRTMHFMLFSTTYGLTTWQYLSLSSTYRVQP